MRLGLRDALVTIAGTLACAVFIVAFLADIDAGDPDALGEPIGVLVVKKRIAQRRPAARSLWISLDEEEPLYDLDAVRTDSGSEALVRLNDSTELLLSENSLVVFDFSGERRLVDFIAGSVSARRAQAQPNASASTGGIVLRAERVELSLERGSMRVSDTGEDRVSVSIAEGRVLAKDSQGEAAIGPDRSLDLSAAIATPKPVALALLSPAPGAALLQGPNLEGVAFAWRAYDAVAPFTVEVSRSSSFEDSSAASAPGEEARLVLSPGDWYWRVVDATGTSSESGALKVLSASPPRPLEPPDEAGLRQGGADAVRLSWEPLDGATAYEYELSATSDFTAPSRAGRSVTPAVALSGLGLGEYHWRVRARFDYGGVASGAYSAPGRFTLLAPPEFPAPVLLEPAPEAGFALGSASEGLVFSWDGGGRAASYELFITAVGAPEATLPAWSGGRAWARVSFTGEPGDYVWHVVSRSDEDKAVLRSKSQRFSLHRSEAPSPIGPADGAEFEVDTDIDFAWSSRGAHRLVVFATAEGETPLESANADSGRATLRLSEPGTYWWRLETPDGLGSRPRRIVVAVPLKAPEALSPPPGAELVALPGRSLSLEWSPVLGAQAYRLVLRALGSERPVVSARVAGSPERVPFLALGEGDYTLQVSAERGGAAGAPRLGPSSTTSFTIRSPSPLPVPRLRSPRSGSTLDMTRASSLDFAWDPVPGANAYELELRRLDSGRLVFRRQLGASTGYAYRNLVELDRGVYVISLRAFFQASDGIEERSSPAGAARFTLEASSSSAAPTLLSPRELYVLEP